MFGIAANIAVGSLGFRAELDTDPKGERSRPYYDLRTDLSDSTAILDGNDPAPSQIVFNERGSGSQEPPVPGTQTTVATGDSEHGDCPTGERYYSSCVQMFTWASVPSFVRRVRR